MTKTREPLHSQTELVVGYARETLAAEQRVVPKWQTVGDPHAKESCECRKQNRHLEDNRNVS